MGRLTAEGHPRPGVYYTTQRYDEGRTEAPEGLFADVALAEFLDMQAGSDLDVMGCGVRVDRTLACWGNPYRTETVVDLFVG